MSMNRADLRALLHEEGLEHDADLEHAMVTIAALGAGPVPEPRGQLARLMNASARRSRVASLSQWSVRRRGVVIGALVVAGMGAGVSTVAAVTGQPWPWEGRVWSIGSVDHSAPAPTPEREGAASSVDPASVPAASAPAQAPGKGNEANVDGGRGLGNNGGSEGKGVPGVPANGKATGPGTSQGKGPNH